MVAQRSLNIGLALLLLAATMVIAQPSQAATNQSCGWSDWVNSPVWCWNFGGNGTKYAWDEVSYQVLGGQSAGDIWVDDNDYAGCNDCLGQSDVPDWKRLNSTIGTYQVGSGAWHSNSHTTQWGYNPATVQTLGAGAKIKICYEATSQNGYFCSDWTTTMNLWG